MGGLNSSTPRHTFIYFFWCGSAIIFFVLLLCLNSYSLVLFTFHIGLLAFHPEDRKNETLGVEGGSGEVYEHFVAHYKTCELKQIDFKDINKSMQH